MPNDSPERISNEIQDILQQAIFKNYPNPERKGCPGNEILKSVAARPTPVEDAIWEHVTHCSPCYREFLAFRRELAAARKRRVLRNQALLASVLGVAVIVGILIWKGIPRSTHPPTQPVSVETVDLRPFEPTRGETRPSKGAREVATLQRQPVELKILLPVASDEGKYEIRLMDSDLRTLLSRTASTSFVDNIATISVTFDLSPLMPGRYVLGLRGPDGAWRTPPIAIR